MVRSVVQGNPTLSHFYILKKQKYSGRIQNTRNIPILLKCCIHGSVLQGQNLCSYKHQEETSQGSGVDNATPFFRQLIIIDPVSQQRVDQISAHSRHSKSLIKFNMHQVAYKRCQCFQNKIHQDRIAKDPLSVLLRNTGQDRDTQIYGKQSREKPVNIHISCIQNSIHHFPDALRSCVIYDIIPDRRNHRPDQKRNERFSKSFFENTAVV